MIYQYRSFSSSGCQDAFEEVHEKIGATKERKIFLIHVYTFTFSLLIIYKYYLFKKAGLQI
jgi:hypothetical protein